MKDCSLEKKWDKNAWDMPIAMAYVPWQRFKMYENLEEAYCNGTIFPDLNKPFLGRRCKN